ncbi:primase-helicase family protein [Flavobacterium sp. I3-2]|uniref:primase-helicase family protein n=1 Tax=Flavobacterium sp. I3-2 TaxID=2748319 RepID=UPI0015A90B2B|nr:primase-helicase family protein [Flavobacterium sp. I3-2]
MKLNLKELFEAIFKIEGDKVEVHQLTLISVIEQLGFGICRDEESPYNNQLLNKVDNLIEIYNEKNLGFKLIQLMKESDVDSRFIEKFIRGCSGYVASNKLQLLKTIELDLIRDTRTETFIPFRNVMIKITELGYEIIDYKNLQGSILADSRIKRDFIQVDSSKDSNFKRFCELITGENPKRLEALKSVMGYLLHNNKEAKENKAIIIYDAELGNRLTANGGNGKTLLINGALKQLRNVIQIDGKSYDPRSNRFLYQGVTPSTNIILFDDVNQAFNFEHIFSVVTGDLKVEKKNKQSFDIDYKHAPKFVITSNQEVKMPIGSSSRRRKVELIIDNFFNEENTPMDYFNEVFFSSDWSGENFCRFFMFMFDSIKTYHEKGVFEYKCPLLLNAKIKKIVGNEFFTFLEEDLIDYYGEWILKSEVITQLKDEYNFTMSPHSATKMIKKYCDLKGMLYQEKNSGGKLQFMVSVPNSSAEKVILTKDTEKVVENTIEVSTEVNEVESTENMLSNE